MPRAFSTPTPTSSSSPPSAQRVLRAGGSQAARGQAGSRSRPRASGAPMRPGPRQAVQSTPVRRPVPRARAGNTASPPTDEGAATGDPCDELREPDVLTRVNNPQWARGELNPRAHASHLRLYEHRASGVVVAGRCEPFRAVPGASVMPRGIPDDLAGCACEVTARVAQGDPCRPRRCTGLAQLSVGGSCSG